MRHVRSLDTETGSVVLLALLFTSLLAALGLGLLDLANIDRAMSANYQSGVQTLLAAETLAEHVLAELGGRASWTAVLNGTARSNFLDAPVRPIAPWGETLDLSALTTALQLRTDGAWSRGPNTPSWRLFASGTLATLVDHDEHGWPAYLAAWIADNPTDTDGDPTVDSDGVIVVRAEAIAQEGLRKTVQIFVTWASEYSSVTSEGATDDETLNRNLSETLPTLARNLRDTEGELASPVSAPVRLRVLSWREVQ